MKATLQGNRTKIVFPPKTANEKGALKCCRNFKGERTRMGLEIGRMVPEKRGDNMTYLPNFQGAFTLI